MTPEVIRKSVRACALNFGTTFVSLDKERCKIDKNDITLGTPELLLGDLDHDVEDVGVDVVTAQYCFFGLDHGSDKGVEWLEIVVLFTCTEQCLINAPAE